MKKLCLLILAMVLLMVCESASAAKARSISSDADSAYHAEHLANHLGETNCSATGNYIKMRSKANGSNTVGHLEQADEFILLDVQNGWAQVEVTYADKTSPDSWKGLTGWVNSDCIDCPCSTSEYSNSVNPNSIHTYPPSLPDGWTFSSGAGAWNTEIRIATDGSFWGHYHDADGYTLYESYFRGRFSNIEKSTPHSYSMFVSELQTIGIPGSQYQKNYIQHIITEPAGIAKGDYIEIFIPGAKQEQLTDDHLSWLHGIITNPLSDYAFCNISQGVAFDPGSELEESGIPNSISSVTYYCKANNLRVRSKPISGEIIGHIEKADQFIVLEISDGWANITVTHAADTSSDSWEGLTGWVSTDYIESKAVTNASSSWKEAYYHYLTLNSILHYLDDYAEFWLAYIDNDSIPELIINTTIVAGGCHVLTYHNGKVDAILIGSTGTPSYIERGNLLLDSAGHQGCYYDTVYTIINGKWKQIYHAENYELPSSNFEIDTRIIHTYYIDDQEVTKSKYNSVLYSHFDRSKATKLVSGKSIKYLFNELQ